MGVEFRKSGVIAAGGDDINANLLPNARTMALGSANASTGTWRNAGSNTMTKSRVLITDSPIGECYGFQNVGIQTPNDGSCYGIDSFPMDASSTYTISMWARCANGDVDATAGFNVYASTDVKGSHAAILKNYRVTTLPSTGEWVRCWLTVTTNTNTTRNIYIGIVTGETSVTTQMCALKLEKSDHPTIWVPHTNDDEYISAAHGFAEYPGGTQLFENHFVTDDFIEY
jgi:hypothetical protein